MWKPWKLVSLVAVCLAGSAFCGVASFAEGDQQKEAEPNELSLSPLAAFAARSTATVVWSKTIGRLESQESRATITALMIEDKTETPSVRRGLRIDLAHTIANPSCDWKYLAWTIMCKRANAAVSLEEERLETVANMIERGAAELRPRETISRYETTAWGEASMGLIVCGYQFSERQPANWQHCSDVAPQNSRTLPPDRIPPGTRYG